MPTSRIVAVLGALTMFGIAFALSSDRRKVSLKLVLWGIGLQWAMAALLLWLPAGQAGLHWLATGVEHVLAYSYTGSSFLFGQLGLKATSNETFFFAFQVLPTIIFVAALFSVLYYLGVMQLIVGVLARVMVWTMGTSGAESLSVGASVFMGQTEAPLTIRPYLERLTRSELFLVMVSGMATVSGAILGAYVAAAQIEMKHLLAAVAMTAPACVVTSKLMMPEVDKPETSGEGKIQLERPKDSNILLAAAQGTTDGLQLALNVGAMLIAFIALVALVNGIFGLIPVGGEPLTLERMLGWAFAPFAFLMGVPWADCVEVGSVLGTRTILNEILAFKELAELGDGIEARSKDIAIYAVTGFANVSSIGIQIGGLGALAPGRRADIAKLGVRALIAATLANFSTACVAGALL